MPARKLDSLHLRILRYLYGNTADFERLAHSLVSSEETIVLRSGVTVDEIARGTQLRREAVTIELKSLLENRLVRRFGNCYCITQKGARQIERSRRQILVHPSHLARARNLMKTLKAEKFTLKPNFCLRIDENIIAGKTSAGEIVLCEVEGNDDRTRAYDLSMDTQRRL
jgi:hypothetical protein